MLDTTLPQRKRATQKRLEKKHGKANVDGGLQSRHSWRKIEGPAHDSAGSQKSKTVG